MHNLLEHPVLINWFTENLSNDSWLKAFEVLIFFAVIRLLYKVFIYKIFALITEKTQNKTDDLILQGLDGPIQLIIMLIGLYYFIIFSPLNFLLKSINTHSLWNTFLWIACFWFLNNIADISYKTFSWLSSLCGMKFSDAWRTVIIATFRIFVTFGCIVGIGREWEQDLTGLLAGLGIGGIAIAIAAQDTLANIYGGLSVFIDKPFERHQYVSIDGVEGCVENITLRSTRIRTFDRFLVSIPNSTLAKEAITNYSKSNIRRIRFKLHVSYKTSQDQLECFIGQMKDYLQTLSSGKNKELLQYGQNVSFDAFGNNSIDILIICYSFFNYVDENEQKGFGVNLTKVISNILNNIKKMILGFDSMICNTFKASSSKRKINISVNEKGNPLQIGTALLEKEKSLYHNDVYEGEEYVVAYFEHLKLRNKINMKILGLLKENGIEIQVPNINITEQ